MSTENNLPKDQTSTKKPSVGQIVVSVLAAAFGVQTSKNRERDFAQSSFTPYIIAGVLFTIFFVGVVYLVVSLVLQDV